MESLRNNEKELHHDKSLKLLYKSETQLQSNTVTINIINEM